MTKTDRHRAILALIERYTAVNTVSPEAARSALIREGIYTKKGTLRAEYGGKPTARGSKPPRK